MEILTEKEQEVLLNTLKSWDKTANPNIPKNNQNESLCNLKETHKDIKICDFATGYHLIQKLHIAFVYNWFNEATVQLQTLFSNLLKKKYTVNILSVDTMPEEQLWKYISLPAYMGKIGIDEFKGYIVPDKTIINWLLQYPVENRNDIDLSKKEIHILEKQCYKPITMVINNSLDQFTAKYDKQFDGTGWSYKGFEKRYQIGIVYEKPSTYIMITMGIEPAASEMAFDPKNSAELNIILPARVVKLLGDDMKGIQRNDCDQSPDLSNLMINLQASLGYCKLTIDQLHHLHVDDVVQLNALAGTDVDLISNNQILAHGEVIIDGADHYAIRITGFPK